MACIVLTPSRSAPTPRFFPVTFNPTPPQPPLQFTIPVPVQPRAGFRPPVSPARIDDFSRSSIAASPRAQGPAMLGGVDINQLANPRSPSLLPFDMPMSIRRMGSAPGTPTTIPLMEINQLSQVCFQYRVRRVLTIAGPNRFTWSAAHANNTVMFDLSHLFVLFFFLLLTRCRSPFPFPSVQSPDC